MEFKRIGNKYFVKKKCSLCGLVNWKRKDTKYTYCSIKCAMHKRKKNNGDCLNCKKSLPSKMPNGTQFVPRKFCNKKCSSLFYTNENHPSWTGGFLSSGYKKRYLGNGRYKREHVWVMEKEIGRELKPGEIVHHINHDRADNRIENLQITTQEEHSRYHANERWMRDRIRVDMDYVKKEMASGRFIYQIAKSLGISKHTIYRRLKKP